MAYELDDTKPIIVLRDGRIDCHIRHPRAGSIAFTASPRDPEVDGLELFRMLEALPEERKVRQGPKAKDELAREAREERAILLAEHVDRVAGNAIRWAELTSSQQASVRAYRRALLDLPQQAGFPEAINWPTPPVL